MFTNSTQLSRNVANEQFTSLQLSYSTADIEQSIFYEPENKPITTPSEPRGRAIILVVHGEMFTLEEKTVPQPSTPLTEESGLFQIIGIAEQPNLPNL